MKVICKGVGKGKTRGCYKRIIKLAKKKCNHILFIAGKTFVTSHACFGDFSRILEDNYKSIISQIDYGKGIIRCINGSTIQFIGMDYYFKNREYFHRHIKIIDNLDLVFPYIDTVSVTKY
ncbi:MAG: hypothetical protein IKS48_00370 [Eubacterium sp.]|nr:hypothetical protein [Eubacterium sp.]